MKHYEITILKSTSKALNESISEVPVNFYVECANNVSAVKCLSKIAKKFRNEYGVIIESANIELIDEGWWDRFKARESGGWARSKARAKNLAHIPGNAIRRVANGAKAMTSNNPSEEQYHDMKHEDVQYEGNKAKIKSLVKSKVKKFAKLSKDIKIDFDMLDIELDERTEKLLSVIDAYCKYYS